MTIKATRLKSGSIGYQVINEAGKTVCTSSFRLDCEQYVYAMKLLHRQ